MLLGTLAVSILGNTLTGNGIIRAGERVKFLMLPYPLSNFEIKKNIIKLNLNLIVFI